jgi:transposase
MPARDVARLRHEIAEAKRRLRLPADCLVISCYEAGRDGFWLHRCLESLGVRNLVVDSSSIEVNRRRRRAKSDGLDVEKLLSMLLRHVGGETKLWSVVQVPTPEEEQARQLHRELLALQKESTGHTNRLKSLLAACGLEIQVDRHLPKRLKELRQWDGAPLPAALHQRLLREFERLQVVNRQVRQLEQQRARAARSEQSPAAAQVRKLLGLRGIGLCSAWLYVHEFFGWRKFKNRRQVGSLAGLTPTPYASGQADREQGISKAGNKRLRWMAVEIAWGWLRWQPDSELSRWFYARFARGSSRQRRIGIVALARKLLVAIWKYLETGVPPAGVELSAWQPKTRILTGDLQAAAVG